MHELFELYMLQLDARKWDEKTYWKPETRCLFSGLLRHLKQTSQQKTFAFGIIHWWMVCETFCFLIEWKLVWARTERCLVWEIAVWLILHSINPLLIHVRSGFSLLRTERKASSSGRFSFLKHGLIFTQYRESGGRLEKLRLWHKQQFTSHFGWMVVGSTLFQADCQLVESQRLPFLRTMDHEDLDVTV